MSTSLFVPFTIDGKFVSGKAITPSHERKQKPYEK